MGAWSLEHTRGVARFQLAYKFIPTFSEQWDTPRRDGVLNRDCTWQRAAAYLRASAVPVMKHMRWPRVTRPNRYQLMKFGYQVFSKAAVNTLFLPAPLRTAGYGVSAPSRSRGIEFAAPYRFPAINGDVEVSEFFSGRCSFHVARPLTLGVLSEV